jgi:hypothetical protein
MATPLARLARLEAQYAEPPPPLEWLPPVQLAERAGLGPDDWQRAVLTSTAPRQLLNCCRQSGKSTITAVLAAHVALYEPGALVLCLSPTERQSGELLRKVVEIYHQAGRPVPADSERRLALELANGSRILALPGARDETVRGLSAPRLVLLDEASRISDALWHAVSPMVAVSGGRVIMLSTPYGRRGVFHQLWTEGGAAWARVEVPATACPRITPEFLATEQATLPHWAYDQEYCCQFTDTDASVFRYEDIQAALSSDVAPLFAPIGGAA